MSKLLLIDASPYIFRAYYSIPDSMRDSEGKPCNAIYGFINFLFQVITQAKPEFIAVAFDDKLSSSFRNEIYPEYKQHREPVPEALSDQFSMCLYGAEALGLPVFMEKSYEADDLIGTLAKKLRSEQQEIWIVSSDKDLAQLITPGDTFWDFARNRQLDEAGVQEHFGVRPDQFVDYLALMGDQVDNIPGVPGIGPKSACALLQHFDTLENTFENIDEISNLKIRGAKSIKTKLQDNKDQAFLSQKLAMIATDAPVDVSIDALACRPVQSAALEKMFDFLNFGSALRTRISHLESM
ncbi:MAG: exodeoxyribonuclease IX [Calditrichaeota bacterium]|nr:MAG: exodeoxyribonuclease IX [Calditrichota bacterium]